jgi:hypothetical protein
MLMSAAVLVLEVSLAASSSQCDCAHFPWQPDPPCMETCGTTLVTNPTLWELQLLIKTDIRGQESHKDRSAAIKLQAEHLMGETPSFSRSLGRLSQAQKSQLFKNLSRLAPRALLDLLKDNAEEEYGCHGGEPMSYGGGCIDPPSSYDELFASIVAKLDAASVPVSDINLAKGVGGVVVVEGSVRSSEEARMAEKVISSFIYPRKDPIRIELRLQVKE